MSNLGWYQHITTISKKVGDPKNLFVIVLALGGVLGVGTEKAIKKGIQTIKNHKNNNVSGQKEFIKATFEVTLAGTDKQGLSFVIGDKFNVIDNDGNAVLIEKIGDENNPYFVTAEFLSSISDFNLSMKRKI